MHITSQSASQRLHRSISDILKERIAMLDTIIRKMIHQVLCSRTKTGNAVSHELQLESGNGTQQMTSALAPMLPGGVSHTFRGSDSLIKLYPTIRNSVGRCL